MLKGMFYKCPTEIKIKNKTFKINTDFRIFITYEEEIKQGIDTKKAVINALYKFFPAFSYILSNNLQNEAIMAFLWFYKCGKEDVEHKNTSNNNTEVFRYSYDDQYIWGDFKRYFNVDLTTDYIHWWKFKSMWLSIPTDSEFNKIKGYRSYKGKDKDILELKEYYKLPLTKKEKENRERQNKIYEELKKGD